MLKRLKVYDLVCTPTLLSSCSAVSSLAAVCTNGEKLPAALMHVVSRTVRCERNVYGPTEAAVAVTLVRCVASMPYADSTIGGGLPNVLAQVDGDNFELCSAELVLGGQQVARGYLYRPETTSKVFNNGSKMGSLQAPDAASLYSSGDLSRYLPDGTIAFMGRIDCQVKLRGFRIELGEIENVLLSLTSSVISAACALVNNEYLAAYVVVDVGADDQKSAGSLTRHCSQHLPHYMVPSVFVFLDTMPLNRSGKVDRRALPSPPKRDTPAKQQAKSDAAPTTPLEAEVLRLAARALRKERPLCIEDNFFSDLGGNSVQAVVFVNTLRADLCPAVSLRDIFEAANFRALAAAILQRCANELPPRLRPAAVDGTKVDRSVDAWWDEG